MCCRLLYALEYAVNKMRAPAVSLAPGLSTSLSDYLFGYLCG